MRAGYGAWVMLDKGVSRDIIQAGCLAYIHAVNRFWEASEHSAPGPGHGP